MREISDEMLSYICAYRIFRYDEDSHCRGGYYCRLLREEDGQPMKCNYQCTSEKEKQKDMTDDEFNKIVDEYEKYSKGKHALPLKIWMRHKKKFDEKTITEFYRLMKEGANDD